jgi:hypothetical protein
MDILILLDGVPKAHPRKVLVCTPLLNGNVPRITDDIQVKDRTYRVFRVSWGYDKKEIEVWCYEKLQS